MADHLTAAEFAAIGERSAKAMAYIACEEDCPCSQCVLIRDRASLHAATERLIGSSAIVYQSPHNRELKWFHVESLRPFDSKAAAIDVLMGGGK